MKLWFKAKTYGYGWTPVTWQGWAVVLLYGITLAGNVVYLDSWKNILPGAIMYFFMNVIVLTIFLITISYLAGEEPAWRWGNKDTLKKTDDGK